MLTVPEVRAISIRQPWCEAVVDGHKPIENRGLGFPRKWRGIVLLHSSLGWSERGKWDTRILTAYGEGDPFTTRARNARLYALRHVPAYHGRPPHPFLAGYVLGHAELVDVHPDAGCCRPWGESEYETGAGKVVAVAHLVFENPVRYEHPIRAKGRLGLWIPPDEVTAAALA